MIGRRLLTTRTRRVRAALLLVVVLATGAGTFAAGCWTRTPPPTRPAHDPALRDVALSLYLPPERDGPPRALIFLFGNDIGFRPPLQRLAADLARSGYAVAGLDMRPVLAALPTDRPARDSAFARRIAMLIARTRIDVGAPDAPVIIAGHSLGAEVALWTAAYAPVPGVVGVLVMSPGGRSHLRVSPSDLLMTGDPTGPESFAVDETVAAVVRAGRWVAIVRGGHDKLAAVDPALLAAGGPGARRWTVPLAGHSFNEITLVRMVARRALAWIEIGTPPPATSA